MKEGILKGLKPFIIKYMALLMGICYLANPMHEQISSVFHEISHIFQYPENVIAHEEQNYVDHPKHQNGHHHLATSNHQHILIDLIDSVFNGSDEQNSDEETTPVLVKYDKHISSQYTILPKKFPQIISYNVFWIAQKSKKGFSNLPKEPPQKQSA
ncbi:MAG TPA: hypothetical protein ENH87_17975 [Pricia antarctica]|uniref:Uncharacterized protein n=2 Tax=root TaxID=1 RepID=A0A831VQB9_9FLAO|nr:hypothetical protein [Pricia antarctica]